MGFCFVGDDECVLLLIIINRSARFYIFQYIELYIYGWWFLGEGVLLAMFFLTWFAERTRARPRSQVRQPPATHILGNTHAFLVFSLSLPQFLYFKNSVAL